MDIVWLHKYVLELAQKEAEDKWTELDGVRDEWKEGAKGEKEKKGRRRGHTMTQGPFLVVIPLSTDLEMGSGYIDTGIHPAPYGLIPGFPNDI